MGCLDFPNETIFTMEMTSIKFGPGPTEEVAYDLKRLGVKYTSIITDREIMQLGLPDPVCTLITVVLIDPLNTVTLPPMAMAYPGLDVFTHALESYTCQPYDSQGRHKPDECPAYIGSNPISDLWCEKALGYTRCYLRRAGLNGADVEARMYMVLAATYAGIGFGNAGVHVSYALAYPIAGLVKNFSPPGYPQGEPIISHGLLVVITAPSTFRRTYPVSPERHLHAAQLLGGNEHGLTSSEMPEGLLRTLLSLMRDTGIPNGLHALDYGEAYPSALKNSVSSSRVASNTGEEKVTPEGLIELCKQHMANAKYSWRIEIMEESPKTATGKFLLRELRDKTRRQVDALRASESTRIFSNHERQGEAYASETHHRATA